MNADRADHIYRINLSDALLNDGWTRNVLLDLNENGDIISVTPGIKDAQAPTLDGLSIPGLPNVHSHAFQRLLSGMTEYNVTGMDNFWSWREQMYSIAGVIDAEDLYVIARQLYMEMLQAGYTSVAEFHYLHRRLDGKSFDNPAEMALALRQAAHEVGIQLTLLPALYMRGGFGTEKLEDQQIRFYQSLEEYEQLMESMYSQEPHFRLGMAIHSLRAVTPDSLKHAVKIMRKLDSEAPIHIHIAEQQKEVADCLAWTGMRPVEWLLHHQGVDKHWCLIHATHINQTELATLANSGAVVGLCPTTEANLGDGLFPLQAYLTHGGQIAIGSDSNVSVSPVEELRWLEYGQRLSSMTRNIVSQRGGSSGAGLYSNCVMGGAQACGIVSGAIAPGYRGNIVCLDAHSPHLAAKPEQYRLDSFVFSGNDQLVKHVLAGGRWQVKNFKHVNQASIGQHYKKTAERLYSRLART